MSKKEKQKEEKIPLESKFYDAREASELTGLSVTTIYNYCKNGHISYRRMTDGGKYLIPKKVIDNLLMGDENAESK